MSQNTILGVLLCVIGGFLIFLFWKTSMVEKTQAPEAKTAEKAVLYVPLGDSYSNGEGVAAQDAWPVLLINHLKKAGYPIKLVASPAVSGWTTKDLIEGELPEFISAKPDFATLLIGANDIYQGIDAKIFTANLRKILDTMQANMPDKKKIVIVTIPDYSVTPQVRTYPNGRDMQKKIQKFNDILKAEGKKRELQVVDIFKLTQAMGKDKSLVAKDGLHPSAKELALWEKEIFSIAEAMVKK